MKKIIIILFCMILLAGTISAFEFDNVLNYKNKDLRVDFINAFGLGENLGTAELKSHKSVNENLIVGMGDDVLTMYYDFYHWNKGYSKGLGEVYFVDMKTGKKIEKDYNFKYLTYEEIEIDDYEEICKFNKFNNSNSCSYEKVGSHKEQREKWLPFNSKEIPKENITIGLFTDVKRGDYIDGIWTIAGKKVNKHVTWSENLTANMLAYYTFNDSAASTTVIATVGDDATLKGGDNTEDLSVAGVVNNSFDLDGSADYVNATGNGLNLSTDFTVNMWIYPNTVAGGANQENFFDSQTPAVVQLIMNDGDDEKIRVIVGAGVIDMRSAITLSDNTWYMVTFVYDRDGTSTLYINAKSNATDTGSSTGESPSIKFGNYGGNKPFDGRIDEAAVWNKTLNSDEIKFLYNDGFGCVYGADWCGIDRFPSVTLNSPANNTNVSSSLTFNCSVSDDYKLENVSLYINGIINETNSSGVNNTNYLFDKVLKETDVNWTCAATDNSSQTTTASTRIFDAYDPSVNITYPTAKVNYHVINTNLTINWTATDVHIDDCWYNYNGTNISVTCSENTTQVNVTNRLNRNVTFYANDTFGRLGTDNQTWIWKIFENVQTFSANTIEGSTETFVNNIFLGSGETITGINLIYNGTSRSAGYTSLGSGEYNFSSTIIVPSVNVDTNFSFYWEIDLSSGEINSTSRNQTVQSIAMDNCSSYSNLIFNYTIVDEETQVIITNHTMLELTIEMFDTSKTNSILNFSEEYNNTNPSQVCLNINLTNETTYSIYSTAKYYVTNYSIEYYNLQNFSLETSSIPQQITLYDLFGDDATEFQITFKDENFIVVEDALIIINRQYVSEGTFKTVEIPKTDSNGQTVAHLVEKDILYNIIVQKEGIVLGTFNNIIAYCEDVLVGSCFISLNAVTTGEEAFDYDSDIGLFYDFDYNETSRDLQFDFTTTDGSSKNVTLTALQLDQLGNNTVCNEYLISSSGSIICDVPTAVGNETIIVSIFVNGDLEITNYIQAGREFDIGDSGYFLMFFLVISLALMATQSKVAVIIGVVLGFISGVLLSFVRGGILGIGSSVIWLVVMAIILIYKLNSQGQT